MSETDPRILAAMQDADDLMSGLDQGAVRHAEAMRKVDQSKSLSGTHSVDKGKDYGNPLSKDDRAQMVAEKLGFPTEGSGD